MERPWVGNMGRWKDAKTQGIRVNGQFFPTPAQTFSCHGRAAPVTNVHFL